MNDFEKVQLVVCATLDTVERRRSSRHVGKISDLFELVKQDWPGSYEFDDWMRAFELMKETRFASQSAFEVAEDFISVSSDMTRLYKTAGAKYPNPERQLPVIHEYQTFGRDWLKTMWKPNVNPIKQGVAPTADGLVSFDHNADEFEKANSALEELKDALVKGNDVGNLSVEGVAVAVREVDQLQINLQSPSVRLSSIRRQANDTLKWIAEQAAGAVVGAFALAALAALGVVFGVSF